MIEEEEETVPGREEGREGAKELIGTREGNQLGFGVHASKRGKGICYSE